MKPRICVLCGGPLPSLPWWRRPLWGPDYPVHTPTGPEGLACYNGLRKRFGLPPSDHLPTGSVTELRKKHS